MRLVIVGCNPSESSVRAGHYYAGRGNQFWPLLRDSGVLPEPLDCHDDKRVIEFAGILRRGGSCWRKSSRNSCRTLWPFTGR
ncbi:MAG: hypothetical protein LAN61_07305 [Acidobacteriia bacterium]|nr:hypothetical protein [Terriglobia bacterium]